MDCTTVNRGQGHTLRKFTGHTAGEASPRFLSGPLTHAAMRARPGSSLSASRHCGQVSSLAVLSLFSIPCMGTGHDGCPRIHVHFSSVYNPSNTRNAKCLSIGEELDHGVLVPTMCLHWCVRECLPVPQRQGSTRKGRYWPLLQIILLSDWILFGYDEHTLPLKKLMFQK